jgi:hypothetical protein
MDVPWADGTARATVSMHRFNSLCHEAGETLLRTIKQEQGGALVYANVLFAKNRPGDESQIQWCDKCFPPASDGHRITLEYISEVTGKDAAELYADYLEATGNFFIVGLS